MAGERATEEAVQAIIEVESGIDLTPFITAANTLVNQVITDTDILEPQKTVIEVWLSAHFYAVRDPRAVSEKAGPISVDFKNKLDFGLKQTTYGQQALALDTSGALRKVDDGRITASMKLLDPVFSNETTNN